MQNKSLADLTCFDQLAAFQFLKWFNCYLAMLRLNVWALHDTLSSHPHCLCFRRAPIAHESVSLMKSSSHRYQGIPGIDFPNVLQVLHTSLCILCLFSVFHGFSRISFARKHVRSRGAAVVEKLQAIRDM